MVLNAIWLLPEITVSVASNNDDAFHWAFVQRGIDALQRGENILDFWVPGLGLGFPQFLYYQHLPHLSVILLHRALFGAVDPYLLFNLVRYVLLVAFPLTVWWSLRRMDLPPVAAAVGAAASSLLSSDHLYGFDYDSYVWRGFGMYTQLWAMHLTFIALAGLWGLLQRGRGFLLTAIALAALALSHILYAYMMVISTAAMALASITRAGVAGRAARLLAAGVVALLISSYMWVPALGSGQAFVDVSPYLQSWKYDSFGAPQVLSWLVTGRILDAGRVPVITLLVAIGLADAVWNRTRQAVFFAVLFVVWLVLFFGRPTLGPIADLFPLHEGLYFHRFIGGVHIAAIPLAGIGGAALVRLVLRAPVRWHLAPAAVAVPLLLAPAALERAGYYATGADWMRQTDAAIARDGDAATVLRAAQQRAPARTYAGLRSNWGESLDFGIPFRSVHLYNVLTFDGIPEVAPPYAGPSLNADLIYDFDDTRLDHYQLFDARYVIAPTGRRMPDFLRPIVPTTRYTLYEAPTGGIASYVHVIQRRSARTQPEVFDVNRSWFRFSDTSSGSIRFDYPATTSTSTAVDTPGCARGGTSYERIAPARVDLIVECDTAATLQIKVTYHPNWFVTVDDRPTSTFMLSPSVVGLELPAGKHFVTAEYRSSSSKPALLVAGALGLALAIGGELFLRRRTGWWSR